MKMPNVMTIVAGTILALLSDPIQAEEGNLDKTGTAGCEYGHVGQQTAEKQEPANAGSFDTEREGFEPSVDFRLHSISSAAQSTTLPPLQRSRRKKRRPFVPARVSSIRPVYRDGLRS